MAAKGYTPTSSNGDISLPTTPATYAERVNEEVEKLYELVGGLSNGPARTRLTANRTYYVRTDGSDSNDGLSNTSGGAFLTLNKSRDAIAALDLGFDVTVNVAAGTYTAGLNFNKKLVGAGNVTYTGDTTTPGNVVISVTNGSAFIVNAIDPGNVVTIQGFKVQTTTSGYGVLVLNGSRVSVGAMEYGTCVNNHVEARTKATLTLTANYTITGGAAGHILSRDSGTSITWNSRTVTLTGTPSLGYFAAAFGTSYLEIAALTIVGLATGKKYDVSITSNINTGGINISAATSTVTMTLANPCVITWTGHPLVANNRVRFTTTGSLPASITASVDYYVETVLSANTFTISATLGGAAIDTSLDSQSGTHTARSNDAYLPGNTAGTTATNGQYL